MEDILFVSKGFFVLFGIGVLLLIVIVSGVTGYNSLVDVDVEVDRTQSEVINRLNQRQDLIGQLLPTVVGLQEHAESIYEMITEARAKYTSAISIGDVDGIIEADAMVVEAMNQLLVVVEQNPNITATGAFLTLMDNISAIESALAQARRDYNTSVSDYNGSVRKFPKAIYASMFGFEKEKPYWALNDGANDFPQIEFD
jgi:LemA protein